MGFDFGSQGNALELFTEGKSTAAYEFFGAHYAATDDKIGTCFRVWAPNAQEVSVYGGFNGCDLTAYPMEKKDGGVWELFIEGARQGDLYKFCITTPESEQIMKSDPYAFRSQRNGDHFSEIYDIDCYSWNDAEWMQHRTSFDYDSMPVNVYELHLGTWSRNEADEYLTYTEIAHKLIPYVKDMGYTHVEFMPLTEYPFGGSWGFQPTGYFSATSRYGMPHELMYLIDSLHKEGIGVILDWVPSNFPKDSFGLVKFDGTALYENEDPKLGERPSWDTCLFDFSKPEVVSFMTSSALFWVNKFHIDGLRFGALTSMIYLDFEKVNGEWRPNKLGGKENLEAMSFIRHVNTAIHQLHPEIKIYAQESSSYPKLSHTVENGGFGFDYKWNMGWMNDMLRYMAISPEWKPFNYDMLTYSFFYAFTERFLLPISHDEVSHGKGSLWSKMPGDDDEKFAGVRAFISFMYAHPGKKLIFMGSEFGSPDEWRSLYGLNWDNLAKEKNKKLNDFFKAINSFYLTNRPLYELDTVWKGFDWIHHDDFTQSVIAFKRIDGDGNEIIVVCNFEPTIREGYYIGVSKYGVYDEVFSSDEERFGGSGILNGKGIIPEIMKIHSCEQGLPITLPPLSVIYLKCVNELPYPEQNTQADGQDD